MLVQCRLSPVCGYIVLQDYIDFKLGYTSYYAAVVMRAEGFRSPQLMILLRASSHVVLAQKFTILPQEEIE